MILRNDKIKAENAKHVGNLFEDPGEIQILYQLDLYPITGELARLLTLNDENRNYFAAMSAKEE